MINEQKLTGGFVYRLETIRKSDGAVVAVEEVHNIVPVEGLNHIAGVIFGGASAASGWYVGLYKGAYTPTADSAMATFAADATEFTGYDGATRKAVEFGTVSDGAIDNNDAPSEFDFTATDSIYGGFISSSSAKGGTSGVLISAVRFPAPKPADPDFTLRVRCGFTLASIS